MIVADSGGRLTPAKTKSTFQKTELDNGIRVVTESIPHLRSLALGFWFDTGSRDETDDVAGIAHFIEHMMFKGTKKRNSIRIAREIEGKGGHLNAYTSREVTCYYARVIDEQASCAVDVLSDITFNSLFNPIEVDRERDVIVEELKAMEDTPDDIVYEYFSEHAFKKHPLGRTTLGTRDTLAAITSDTLINYAMDHYTKPRIVISAAGNVNHARLVKMVERRIPKSSGIEQIRTTPPSVEKSFSRQDVYTTTQQSHIIWGCRGLTYFDPQKYVLYVLSTILGGGMSSRLFQTIREKHGLAYTVYSFSESYHDSGLFGIYAGTQPENVEKSLKLIRKEVQKIATKPVSRNELARIKAQLKGNLMLGLESPNARMHRLAKLELHNEDWKPIDHVISQIDAVTAEDVQSLSHQLFEEQGTFSTILHPKEEEVN